MDADLELENNLSSLMESDQSWESLSASYSGSKDIERKHVSEGNNRVTVSMVSLDSILPDDVLEKIFSFLPIASVIRAASVCKVWYHIIHSMRFIWANKLPQKPWYFMFTFNEAATGYAYDPVLRKWYNIDLPCIEKSNWFVSSSNGLVCFMDNDTRSRIFVCNPIIRDWKRILEPPGVVFPDYSSLAISVDRSSHRYTIVVIKSKQVPDDFSQWDFSIHTYNSESESWESSINTVLSGWRGGDESVICNGVLYCLIHSTGVVGNADLRHRLMMYDISATTPHVSSMQVTIPVPCSLTCGRLINLKERLVMVGGIAKYDKPDIIKGIGIWELDAGEWVEVARVPHRFFQGFGELDDVFASSGTEDLIFIQSYGATALLVFDMSQKQWKWSAKCPVTKRFPLQLFTGFCFEPRLEMVS
ncbi:F-box/kelch-repeat protein At3g61590 isoform X1 [Musa acuminata AAA Group]|uniref:F-box/kelch-repeat protein At3g61590 isoform X1 n=2 Tax=Musa acuminata AAA Group TaxID=214697 RepID=UPI0031DD233B